MLAKLKLLLGIYDTSKDPLLTELLSQCSANALAFTHLANTSTLEEVIVEMAVYRYNLIGSEGLSKEEYSGVTYNYEYDYPDYILAHLRSHRKARRIG